MRAAIEEDAEAIHLLMESPPSQDVVQQLTMVAASALEKGLGAPKAVETVDHWVRLTLVDLATNAARSTEGGTP